MASQTTLTVIVGRKGSGKSTWLRKQLREISHLLLWDPNDEHADLVPTPPPPPPVIGDGTLDKALEYLGWIEPRQAEAAPPILPDTPEGDGPQVVRVTQDFESFLELVGLATGYTVAIDEAHAYWATHRVELDRLVQTMRHREQDMLFISHRIAWVPQSIMTQIDVLVSFRMTWPPDLERIKEYFDVDIDALTELNIGQFVKVEI